MLFNILNYAYVSQASKKQRTFIYYFFNMNDQKIETERPFTKDQVVDSFISAMTAEAAKQFDSAEKSFKTSAEMDGKMQSRYDTQKEDHAAEGNMKLASARKLQEKVAKLTERREQGIPDASESIGTFSLFQLEDMVYGGTEWFLLSDVVGGITIDVNGERVIGLNPETPLGAFAEGKTKGKLIRYDVHGEEQKFKVLDII